MDDKQTKEEKKVREILDRINKLTNQTHRWIMDDLPSPEIQRKIIPIEEYSELKRKADRLEKLERWIERVEESIVTNGIEAPPRKDKTK